MDIDHPGATSAAGWAFKDRPSGLVYEEDPPLTEREFEEAERLRESRHGHSLRDRLARLLRRQG